MSSTLLKEQNNYMGLDCSWFEEPDLTDEEKEQRANELILSAKASYAHLKWCKALAFRYGISANDFNQRVTGGGQ